ncbi:hypothetical protein ACROYT_G009795 [Oculina patagonica]
MEASRDGNTPDNANDLNASESSKKTYQFDDLLRLVGGFGRYPMLLYGFMCLMTVPIGLQQLVLVFYGASPPFQCAASITASNNDSVCGVDKCCANCTKYEFTGEFTSAVSEWELICSRKHLKALSQAAYLAGLLIGSYAFSSISDHFGRRIAIFLSISFLAGCGTVSAVADCLSLFALFRVGAGAAAAGCLLSRFVYCLELSVTSNRTAAGFVSNIFMTLGYAILSLLAYVLRDWRHLMLAVSLPGTLLLVFWWWIPESPRWLLANNRLDEAHSLLMKYAAKNGVKVDAKHLKHVISEVRKADVRKDDTRKYGTFDLFRTPKLRKRIIICCFNWFVNALVYFGLSLNVKNLAGDMYVNFFILIIIELPSALLAWFCLQRFGRRIPYCTFMLIGGLAGMLVLAVPDKTEYQPVITTLAMIGKFCILSTFLTIYVFTAELFPTVIRNIGVGVSSMMARIGAILAPYIVLLAELPNLNKTLPLVIFGVLGVAAGIMALWLPETLFSPMPQTVEQAEAWDEDYKIYCCKRPGPKKSDKNEDTGTGEEQKLCRIESQV